MDVSIMAARERPAEAGISASTITDLAVDAENWAVLRRLHRDRQSRGELAKPCQTQRSIPPCWSLLAEISRTSTVTSSGGLTLLVIRSQPGFCRRRLTFSPSGWATLSICWNLM